MDMKSCKSYKGKIETDKDNYLDQWLVVAIPIKERLKYGIRG
jgi:hypothetical protein